MASSPWSAMGWSFDFISISELCPNFVGRQRCSWDAVPSRVADIKSRQIHGPQTLHQFIVLHILKQSRILHLLAISAKASKVLILFKTTLFF